MENKARNAQHNARRVITSRLTMGSTASIRYGVTNMTSNTGINIDTLKISAFDAITKGEAQSSSGVQTLAYIIMYAAETGVCVDARGFDLGRWYECNLNKDTQLEDDASGYKALQSYVLPTPAFDKGERNTVDGVNTMAQYRARKMMLTRAFELAGALAFAAYTSADFHNGNPPTNKVGVFHVMASNIFNMKGKKFVGDDIRDNVKRRNVAVSAAIPLNGSSYTATIDPIGEGTRKNVNANASVKAFIESVSEVKKKQSGQSGNIADHARSLSKMVADATKNGAYLSGANIPLLRNLLNSLLIVKVEQRDADGTVNVVPLSEWAPQADAITRAAEQKAA